MSTPEHSPLPPLRMHYRGTKGDIKRGHDYYRIDVSDDIDSVGIHVHRGCFDKADHKQVAQFIVTACNSYYDNKAAIAELVEALDFYACVDHYDEGYYKHAIVMDDKGAKARALIARHKAVKP